MVAPAVPDRVDAHRGVGQPRRSVLVLLAQFFSYFVIYFLFLSTNSLGVLEGAMSFINDWHKVFRDPGGCGD